MQGFKGIQYSQYLNGPAGVNLDTGVLYINPAIYPGLSDFSKRFVTDHELGHLIYGDSEFAADNYAFWKNLDLNEDSLSKVKLLYDALPFDNKEQIERAEALLQTALQNELSKKDNPAQPYLESLLQEKSEKVSNWFGEKIFSSDLSGLRDTVASKLGDSYTVIYDTVNNVQNVKKTEAELQLQEQKAREQMKLNEEKALQDSIAQKEEKEAQEKENKKQENKKITIIASVIVVVIIIVLIIKK